MTFETAKWGRHLRESVGIFDIGTAFQLIERVSRIALSYALNQNIRKISASMCDGGAGRAQVLASFLF